MLKVSAFVLVNVRCLPFISTVNALGCQFPDAFTEPVEQSPSTTKIIKGLIADAVDNAACPPPKYTIAILGIVVHSYPSIDNTFVDDGFTPPVIIVDISSEPPV